MWPFIFSGRHVEETIEKQNKCNQCNYAPLRHAILRDIWKYTLEKAKQMQPVWLWVYATFENAVDESPSDQFKAFENKHNFLLKNTQAMHVDVKFRFF